ncbi:Snf7-domain-containing protein [Fimicolochytrium jonesii]|uniref:Snf7-domain-containing protein n=1 Tax=Fimicolochytrium jonesii TaxID=1396493 RepID=UPI0022FF0DA2|nr:Snf7-domain-containing protein [Fimicolochytrium jonesii]KAI8824079.1 Snf7-domain-containing protein [Fimicolochytrium jonesii]
MNLFRRAQVSKTAPKDAIVKLRESLEQLEKRQNHLQMKADTQLKIAKANVTKNKKAALTALKHKKAYEDQINKISGSRMTLEQQMMAIENAAVNLETMNAMKAGADAMKQIHGHLDINKVDGTMDDIREQMDLANEISDAISQPVNFGVEFDEDELNEELELLEQEDLDARLLDSAGISDTGLGDLESAPGVPNTVPAIAQPPRPTRAKPVQNDDDAELEELRASMAMS